MKTETTIEATARKSKSAREFIGAVQQSETLLSQVYAWERGTEERKRKYQHTGWFGIASDFWTETHAAIAK